MTLDEFILLVNSLRDRSLSYKDIEMLFKFEFCSDKLRQFTKKRSEINISENMKKRINLFQYEPDEDKIKRLLDSKATWKNFNGFNRSIDNKFQMFGG